MRSLSFAILATLAAAGAQASTPASHAVTVPTADGQTTTIEWTGTALPGSNTSSECSASVDPSEDHHAIALAVPPGAYAATQVTAQFRIDWDDDLQDLILTVIRDGAVQGSADGGEPHEVLSYVNPAAGAYDVVVCSFATVLPTAYRAKLTLTAVAGTDSDGDGIRDSLDACAATPPATNVGADGCPTGLGAYDAVPSQPGRPRVVVADLDSAINPYHEFFYSQPSQVTRELLAELGVKPQNVVRLTRGAGTTLAQDLVTDAAFWSNVKRGELYHFVGTNIIAASFAPAGTNFLKPESTKNAHGVGTASSVLDANPEAVLLFGEAHTALGSAEIHDFAFSHPAVDIVTTSYGVSFAPGGVNSGVPQPEYRTFSHTFKGVVGNGKLHFSSAGNGPAATFLRAGAGPWWSIGVSGIREDESDGREMVSGYLPDFIADFTQSIPYCTTCKSGRSTVSGTSFSTPRAAGVASRVLLEARRALNHAGGIRAVGGGKVMAFGEGKRITNWELRRALEQGAYVPTPGEYAPGATVPFPPVAPWLAAAWGDLSAAPGKGVVNAALAELGLDGTPRVKDPGFCEFQTKVIELRKHYWDSVAPAAGGWAANTVESDPFVYCASALPAPLHPQTADSDGDGATDDADNCPATANADQADADNDGLGDACDDVAADGDADGVPDDVDNCPAAANPGQEDIDGDGAGDACDTSDDRDLTPDAFTFVERNGVATSAWITSETRSITGIEAPVAVSVSTNGQYRLNGGSWTNAPGQAADGDTIAVRHVSSANPGTTTETLVTVGTYTTPFRSTTTTVDRTPDAFGFETQTGVARATLIESNAITPAGYNAAVAVVAGPGAEYRINGGAWTAASGSLNPGDTLQTRHTSSASALTWTKTYVKVGGVTGYFSTRTQ